MKKKIVIKYSIGIIILILLGLVLFNFGLTDVATVLVFGALVLLLILGYFLIKT